MVSADMLPALLFACTGDTTSTPSTDVVETPTDSTTWMTGDTGGPPPLEPPVAEVVLSDSPHLVLEKRFDITLSRVDETTLSCKSPDDAAEGHRVHISGDHHYVVLDGLLAETTYDCELSWPDTAGEPIWSGTFTTRPLPFDPPTLSVSGDPARAVVDEGYLVVTHWETGPQAVRVLVFDGLGNLRWYRGFRDSVAGLDAEWSGTHMVVGGGKAVPPQLVRLTGEIDFEGPPAAPIGPGWNHEAGTTPDGSVYGLHMVPDRNGYEGFEIEAFDPVSGEVTWSWSSPDHADELPRATKLDAFHANAVSWVDDRWGSAVWVSLRAQSQLTRIDPVTGAVTQAIGPDTGWTLRDTAGTALGPLEWFWGQHAPEIVGDTITLVDNGSTRPTLERYSRVVQYRIVGETELERVWSWTEPGWYEPNMGSVQTLSNGRTLLASGHDVNGGFSGGTTRTSFLAEIDGPTGEVVYRLDFGRSADNLYRAQFVSGCGLFDNARFCRSLLHP